MKPTSVRYFAVTLALLVCAGCGTTDDKPKPSESAPATPSASTTAVSTPTARATAQSAAEALQRSVPEVVQLIAVTEDNDANNLIGRPNGYQAATALVDSRLPKCENPGTDCGAVVEQWPNQAAAQRRVDYIQGILQSSPVLGQEYDTVNGGLLLRVTGDLKPSAAKAYANAFAAR